MLGSVLQVATCNFEVSSPVAENFSILWIANRFSESPRKCALQPARQSSNVYPILARGVKKMKMQAGAKRRKTSQNAP